MSEISRDHQVVREKDLRGIGDFACKPRDAVRYIFTLAYVERLPVETVTASGREIQNFQESDCTEWILPIGIFPTMYINAWAVGTTRTCFSSVVVFLLTSVAKTSTYWWFVSALYRDWLNFPVCTSPTIKEGLERKFLTRTYVYRTHLVD